MRRKRKQRGEIFEVLIFVIFKELMADTKIQIQEAQKTSRLNTKKKKPKNTTYTWAYHTQSSENEQRKS